MKPFLAAAFSLCLLAGAGAPATAGAAPDLSSITNQEASGGLKAALETGAAAAVGKLGAENGFLGNDKVKIPLPGLLEKARPLLKLTGRSQQLDDLVLAMNRAAEAAVPAAKPLLLKAVKSMTVTDAKNILSGGETSVTDFFREKTSAALAQQFLPKVKAVTDKSGLSSKYNAAMAQAGKAGLQVGEDQATVEAYVTHKALDGLFYMIGEEEKAIRRDPLGQGSKLIGKVFGSLR